MSNSVNLMFLLYIVSEEDDKTIRDKVSRALGVQFRPSETEGRELMGRADFDGVVLGMEIHLSWTDETPSANIYRLSGGTSGRAWNTEAELFSLDDYVARLLRTMGISRPMKRDEFSEYCDQNGIE